MNKQWTVSSSTGDAPPPEITLLQDVNVRGVSFSISFKCEEMQGARKSLLDYGIVCIFVNVIDME